MRDSPRPELGQRHGSRAGEWVVDVIGPNGSACFQLNADQAKVIGENVLSAVIGDLHISNTCRNMLANLRKSLTLK